MDKKKESKHEEPFLSWEPVQDSVGVTHWLPPRCKNCDNYGVKNEDGLGRL
jgi:hypothetical protein